MKRGTFAIGGAALLLLQSLLFAGATQAASSPQERVVSRLKLQSAQSGRTSSSPAITRLNAFLGAPGKIANASVYDQQGKPMGAIQKIEMRDGSPSSIEISFLDGGSMITLEASQFTYEPVHNRVTARSGADTLLRMAQAQ
jgi:hypothetical protein